MQSVNGEGKLIVRNVTRDVVVATDAMIANTSETRNRGLLKHISLPQGEGLWIIPSQAVHCFGMKFDIDVLFLSKDKEVLKIKEHMKPRRIAICIWAHSVLELPAGTVASTGTAKGDQLEFQR